MATWRERFTELAAVHGRLSDRWLAGDRNHDQVMGSCEAILAFFRQYGAEGFPNRDNQKFER